MVPVYKTWDQRQGCPSRIESGVRVLERGAGEADTGRIAVYYGCADSYVGLAFTTVDEVVNYILAHDETSETDREVGTR